MSGWTPYTGDAYLDWAGVESWCRAVAADHPDWVSLTEAGRSGEDRPLLLLTVGRQDGGVEDRPALWLDGGTHAAEWTGVMSALFTVSRWIEELNDGDHDQVAWFSNHTVFVMPCISPDGFEALHRGASFLRSTMRRAPEGTVRVGLDPRDMDGDGAIRWMRWRDPAGPYVIDPDVPMFMRPRTLDDDPEDAWFFCDEGVFLNWDGQRWQQAPRKHGLDLNRNFPAHWAPFSMFGMDGGSFALSAPESRAVVDAFTAREHISVGLTNHTYTGCILTQPYREDSPLSDADIRLMERLATDAVKGTDYAVYRIFPDFVYDRKKPVVGVWSDTMSTVFGVPGYTLELWNPFAFCGVENKKPAEFFVCPDPVKIRALLEKFSEIPGAVTDWTPFEHPQLGPVEIGGIDYMRTVRNPPEAHLAAECERGYTTVDRLRRAVARVRVSTESRAEADGLKRIEALFENVGFLATSGLRIGETLPGTPPVSVSIEPEEGIEVIEGALQQTIGHLDGWGSLNPSGPNSVYPGLPDRGHRGLATWWVRGRGKIRLVWYGGRGGRGELELMV